MKNFCEYQRQKASIEAIDIENEYFKLSRNNIDDRLKKSIMMIGILEPPILLDRSGNYIIISGHNRLKILSQSETELVESIILKEIPPELFLHYSLLKSNVESFCFQHHKQIFLCL